MVVLGWIQAEKLNVVINPEAISEVEQPGPPLHLGNVGTEMGMISSSARAKKRLLFISKVSAPTIKSCTASPSSQKEGVETGRQLCGPGDSHIHRWPLDTNKSKQSSDIFPSPGARRADPNRCYSYLLNLLEATVFSGNCVKCVFTSFPLHNQINCFV